MPIAFNDKWKHLACGRLADSEFGVSGHIEVLLRVDVFGHVIHQGRQIGPPGSPIALNTFFAWVVSGSTRHQLSQQQEICFSSTLTGDELLQKFWRWKIVISNVHSTRWWNKLSWSVFTQIIFVTKREGLLYLYLGKLGLINWERPYQWLCRDFFPQNAPYI